MSSNAISTSSYEQLYKKSADDPDNKKKWSNIIDLSLQSSFIDKDCTKT